MSLKSPELANWFFTASATWEDAETKREKLGKPEATMEWGAEGGGETQDHCIPAVLTLGLSPVLWCQKESLRQHFLFSKETLLMCNESGSQILHVG